MPRPLIIAATASALLAAGLVAGQAVAADPGPAPSNGTGTCVCDGTGRCAQDGAGRAGMGGPGNGRGNGTSPGMGNGMGRHATGAPLAGLTRGTLTAAQKTTLAAMAEEEKLSHDVYLVLAKTSGDARFTRIADAETRHLRAVRALLTRYGVNDPTAGKAAGTFASAAVQKQYRDFVARGDDSLAAALAVGRDIEKANIAALAAARSGLSAPDVTTVYTRLDNASARHLRAFGG